jgi:penicillin amidase
MKRRLRRALIAAGAVILFALALISCWLFVTRRPFPRTRGTVRLEGLKGAVEIRRDRYGVPHIFARYAEDLFFAEGYAHAQDRFWQMEFWRRVGAGRLSELFGEGQLQTDIFLRTLGFTRLAEREYALLDPESRGYLDAYAKGVNAYALKRRPARLGLEFFFLKLGGVDLTVEPWTPLNTLTWAKVMAFDLGGNLEAERFTVSLIGTAGVKGMEALFAPYQPGMPCVVGDDELRTSRDRTSRVSTARGPASRRPASRHEASPLALGRSSSLGSNSWVIGGARTASGKPILANDMHLAIQIPSIWYEVALHGVTADGRVERTAECPFQLRGFSFPGVPGVIAGHNDRIAWGHTNLGGDVQDLYVERINPADPDQYEVNGRWADMEIRCETIRVHGEEEPYILRVRSSRHGPIVSDHGDLEQLAGFQLQPGRPFPENLRLTAVALRWTALEPSTLMQAVLRLDRARDFEEFRDALRFWDVPSQNVVYADVDGNIGYQTPGKFPLRSNGDGRSPVPGWTGDYEWKGYIPFEKLPSVYNPEKGYIVTANNPVVGSRYPFSLGTEFSYGERARRIAELIEADNDGITAEDVAGIHGDVYNREGVEIVACLKGLDLWGLPPARGSLEPGSLEAARDLLLAWNGRMAGNSPGAALYGFFILALMEETLRDQYPERFWPPDSSERFLNALHYILRDPENVWWDDARTPELRETRDRILARAFRKGYLALVDRQGRDPERWAWGKVHTVEFRNLTLGRSGIRLIERIFNRGPFPADGGETQVNMAKWSATKPFEVEVIPSMRQIVDLADLGRSLMVHPTGQSGHPGHRHYDDFIPLWRAIRYHPSLWKREGREKYRRETLTLLPPEAQKL